MNESVLVGSLTAVGFVLLGMATLTQNMGDDKVADILFTISLSILGVAVCVGMAVAINR